MKAQKEMGETQRVEHHDPLSPFPFHFQFPSREPENQFPTEDQSPEDGIKERGATVGACCDNLLR